MARRWTFPFMRKDSHTPDVSPAPVTAVPVTGDMDAMASSVTMTYPDDRVGFRGNLKNYDYDEIIQNKEEHLHDIYALADLFVEQDSILRGAIKSTYTNFSAAGKWRLKGGNENDRRLFRAYYRKIGFDQFKRSVFLQYFKYANVYIYLMPTGRLITLPVHLCRIGNVVVDGKPTIEFNCGSIIKGLSAQYGVTEKEFIQDERLEIRLSGYPREVIEAARENYQWVQLDPKRAWAYQAEKEDWSRYAWPMILSCLPALAKKNLISNFEDSQLNLGIRGFIHAKYGSFKDGVIPDKMQLTQLDTLVKKAMSTTALATTNELVDIKFVQADLRYMLESNLYGNVNNQLLSAVGVSGVVVTGVSEGNSSYASAQVSLDTVSMRIKQAQDAFAAIMTEVNEQLVRDMFVQTHYAPEFLYEPMDLKNSTKLQEACLNLWREGVVSTRTMVEAHGLDIEQERERLVIEQKSGTNAVMKPRKEEKEQQDTTEGKVGRPPMEDYETDKSKSMTGKNPKPSTDN